MTIGERINQTRISREMTLEAVGNAIGVTRATIQKYENGLIANIPFDKIESIARVFRVTPAYLMGWSEDDTPLQDELLRDPRIFNLINALIQLPIEKRERFLDALNTQLELLRPPSSDQ